MFHFQLNEAHISEPCTQGGYASWQFNQICIIFQKGRRVLVYFERKFTLSGHVDNFAAVVSLKKSAKHTVSYLQACYRYGIDYPFVIFLCKDNHRNLWAERSDSKA